MQELLKQLMEKANLSSDQANSAVSVVQNFLGDKLPEPIRGTVMGLLSGENASGIMDQAQGLLGGLFGKKE